jgi:hypothetical protein
VANQERQIDLFDKSWETGFDGTHEHQKSHRLIVRGNNESGVAILEIEKESGSGGKPATHDWTKRYQISLKDLVELIEKHGKLVD